MSIQEKLAFQYYIMDLCEELHIRSGKELMVLAGKLHEYLEDALFYYAEDAEYEDYEPDVVLKEFIKEYDIYEN